ncbi:MAG: hypothetical protein QM783_16185 [Phycisphaerales bacterium]
MVSLVCCSWLLFAAAADPQGAVSQPSTPQAATPAKPSKGGEDLSKLSLDELINRLPRVGAEGTLDWLSRGSECTTARIELRRRIDAGAVLNSSQWQSALMRTGVVRFRSKWPKGETVVVAVTGPGTLVDGDIMLQPRDQSLASLHGGTAFELCGTGLDERVQAELHQKLGVVSPGEHNLLLDATLIQPKGPAPERFTTRETVWEGPFTLSINVVPTLDDAVPGVNTPEMDKAVRESIGLTEGQWGAPQNRQATVVFDPDLRAHPELATIAVGLKITLLRDGVVKGFAGFPAVSDTQRPATASIYGEAVRVCNASCVLELPAKVLSDDRELAHWSMKVEARDDGVLECWRADKRWTGSFEMPAAEALKTERARVPGGVVRAFDSRTLRKR